MKKRTTNRLCLCLALIGASDSLNKANDGYLPSLLASLVSFLNYIHHYPSNFSIAWVAQLVVVLEFQDIKAASFHEAWQVHSAYCLPYTRRRHLHHPTLCHPSWHSTDQRHQLLCYQWRHGWVQRPRHLMKWVPGEGERDCMSMSDYMSKHIATVAQALQYNYYIGI